MSVCRLSVRDVFCERYAFFRARSVRAAARGLLRVSLEDESGIFGPPRIADAVPGEVEDARPEVFQDADDVARPARRRHDLALRGSDALHEPEQFAHEFELRRGGQRHALPCKGYREKASSPGVVFLKK